LGVIEEGTGGVPHINSFYSELGHQRREKKGRGGGGKRHFKPRASFSETQHGRSKKTALGRGSSVSMGVEEKVRKKLEERLDPGKKIRIKGGVFEGRPRPLVYCFAGARGQKGAGKDSRGLGYIE